MEGGKGGEIGLVQRKPRERSRGEDGGIQITVLTGFDEVIGTKVCRGL